MQSELHHGLLGSEHQPEEHESAEPVAYQPEVVSRIRADDPQSLTVEGHEAIAERGELCSGPAVEDAVKRLADLIVEETDRREERAGTRGRNDSLGNHVAVPVRASPAVPGLGHLDDLSSSR
jgi:hypothetical protein